MVLKSIHTTLFWYFLPQIYNIFCLKFAVWRLNLKFKSLVSFLFNRTRLESSSFYIFCKYVYTETTILYEDFINKQINKYIFHLSLLMGKNISKHNLLDFVCTPPLQFLDLSLHTALVSVVYLWHPNNNSVHLHKVTVVIKQNAGQ